MDAADKPDPVHVPQSTNSDPLSGSIGHLLHVALPLILAASGHAIKLFCDRMMLSWYGADEIKAAMPAGITWFTATSIFMGTAGYASTFVAQYVGAGEEKRVGQAVWQGLYLALIGSALLTTGVYWAEPLFRLYGHEPLVQVREVWYFRVLAAGGVFTLCKIALTNFWGGRGCTRVIMAVSLSSAGINILLNYVLIFGHYGFPQLGIMGAAWGTVISEAMALVAYIVLFLLPCMQERFATLPAHTLDLPLLWRLLRFGFPNGVHFLLDIGSFTYFVALMGLVGANMAAAGDPAGGRSAQEAATIAFSINAIFFIPMIGLGQGVMILVGQAIGAYNVAAARTTVRSARILIALYIAITVTLFVGVPDILLDLFTRTGDIKQAGTLIMAGQLLYFVAGWMLFDGMWIVHMSAVKAAGDTRFTMVIGVILAWTGFALPCYLAYRWGASIWVLWWLLLGYVILGGTVFYLRYRSGHWQRMRVIDG